MSRSRKMGKRLGWHSSGSKRRVLSEAGVEVEADAGEEWEEEEGKEEERGSRGDAAELSDSHSRVSSDSVEEVGRDGGETDCARRDRLLPVTRRCEAATGLLGRRSPTGMASSGESGVE